MYEQSNESTLPPPMGHFIDLDHVAVILCDIHAIRHARIQKFCQRGPFFLSL